MRAVLLQTLIDYAHALPQVPPFDGRESRSAYTASHITGEATPSYMASISAAADMYKAVPRARIITVLRDPIDRAYSE